MLAHANIKYNVHIYVYIYFQSSFYRNWYDVAICTWAGYCHVVCMAAVVYAHSTVGTVSQPGLHPNTSYIVEENGPSCGLIHKEWLWSCREHGGAKDIHTVCLVYTCCIWSIIF